MASNFNIVAKLTLQGPNNLNAIVRQIQSQLGNINAKVNLSINASTLTNLRNANQSINALTASMTNFRQATRLAAISVGNLTAALTNLNKFTQPINAAATAATNLQKRITAAKDDMVLFGEEAAFALRRFAAFAIPTAIFAALSIAFKQGIQGAIDFEVEMVKLSQVTGRSVEALSDISDEITRLSTGLGVSSRDLSEVATVLAQAGLAAKDTKIALESLARSALAATFNDVKNTTEGAIAAMAQFKLEAKDLQGLIGSLNAVSAQFAVESEDLVSVIRRTGGAFQAAGGNLNELLGLFTSVRATTRESADSIATGFRTIFTRIQRPRTIQFLRELGVELENSKGQFIGPLESIRRLNAALQEIPTTDSRFAAVIEELGGFRQVSKVIPLIQQFPDAIKAMTVAQEGQISIVEDSEIAQKSLANQLTKLREEFFALFREIGQDKTFREFLGILIEVARNTIEVVKAIKPLIPLIGSVALVGAGRKAADFGTGFIQGLTNPNPRRRFARGGVVPGSGDSDSVPALLMPGEFVINKKSAQALGYDKLGKANRFARGGAVGLNKQNLETFQVGENYRPEKRFEFGIIGLGTDSAKINNEPGKVFQEQRSVGVNYGKNQYKFPLDITAGVLDSKSTAADINARIEKTIIALADNSAKKLTSSIGAKYIGKPKNASEIVSKTNLDSIVGGVFEAALAFTGAPFFDDNGRTLKQSNNSSIDFPGGVGAIGKAFGGFPGDLATDAKKKVDITSFIGRNVRAEFTKKLDGIFGGESKGPRKTKEEIQADKNARLVLKREQEKSKSKPLGAIVDQSTAIKNAIQLLKSSNVDNPGLGEIRKGFLANRGLGKFATNAIKQKSQQADLAALEKAINEETDYSITPGALLRSNPQALRKIKRATGGEIPGSGNTDTVPALLTPGEFVINKESAAAIGLSNLQEMNKVQKFAMGGPVRRYASGGTAFGGGTGAALAIGLGSLLPSLAGLSDASKGVVAQFLAVAATAGFLQFQLSAVADTERTRKLSELADPSILFPKSGITGGFNKVVGTLAKNFQLVSLAVGAVSGTLSTFGNSIQEQANTLSKSVKTQKELDKVKEEDVRGSQLSAAGTGAGIGATIGTLIAPGIGTAIGALLGGLAGYITGIFNNNSKELQKNFEQAKFDRTGEELESLFTKFSQNRFASAEVGAAAIANKASEQQTNIATATDPGTVAELRKQFSNNLVNIRGASEALAKGSTSFDEFITKFGGAGKKLLSTITSITGDAAGAKAEVEGIIAAENAAREVRKKQIEADKNIRVYTVGLGEFGKAIRQLADEINETSNTFGNLQSLIGGGFADFKVQDSGDFFTRAATGQVNDQKLVADKLNKLIGGVVDKNSTEVLTGQVLGIADLTSKLPDILERVASQVGFGESRDSASKRFETELNEVNISKELKQIVGTLFNSQLSSRQNSGEAGLAVVVREDVLGLADKLVPEALTAGIKNLDAEYKILTDTMNSVISRISQVNQAEQKLNQERASIIQRQFDFEEQRKVPGQAPSTLNDAGRLTRNRLSALLQGSTNFNGNNFNVRGAGAVLEKINSDIQSLESQQKNNKLGSPEFQKTTQQLLGLNAEANRLRSALSEVANSSALLSKAQEELSRASAARQENKGFAQNLLFADGKQRFETLRTAGFAQQFAKGNLKFEDIKSSEDRKAVFDFLGQFENATPFGGTKTGAQLQDELTKQGLQFEGKRANAPQADIDKLIQETLEISKKEREARANLIKAQDAALAAQQELARVDTLLVAELKKINAIDFANIPKKLSDAINSSAVLTLQTQSKLTGIERGGLQSRVDKFNEARNTVVGRAFGGNIPQAGANVQDIIDIKNAESNIKGIGLVKDESKLSQLNAKLREIKSAGLFRTNQSLEKEVLKEISVLKPIVDKKQEDFDKNTKIINQARENLGPDVNLNNFNNISIQELKDFQTSFANLGEDAVKGAAGINSLQLQIQALRDQINAFNAQITARGGKPQNFARGGSVGGSSISNPLVRFTPKGTDTVPAMLSRGEFVVNADAANRNRGLLEEINNGNYLARGGFARTRGTGRALNAYQLKLQEQNSFGEYSDKNLEIIRNRKKYLDKVENINIFNNLAKELEQKRFGFGGNLPETSLSRQAEGALRSKELRKARQEFQSNQITEKFGLGRKSIYKFNPSKKDEFLSIIPEFAQQEKDKIFRDQGDEISRRVQELIRRSQEGTLKFHQGGIVPGVGNREVPATLLPGEAVFTKNQQKRLGASTGPGSMSLDGKSLSAMTAFTDSISSSFATWVASANRLIEVLGSFNSQIQVTHSPITVAVNVAGMEGLESAIQEKVMKAVNATLASSKAKAVDGKSPFFT